MKNLAGVEACDGDIVAELLTAGINLIPQELTGGEVPTRLRGVINGWEFRRLWYYWSAKPIMSNRGLPLTIANRLYESYGKEVRAGGDCACRPPETWADHYDIDERQIVVDPEGVQEQQLNDLVAKKIIDPPNYTFVKDLAEIRHNSIVTLYHIDSQEGLNAFVQAISQQEVS